MDKSPSARTTRSADRYRYSFGLLAALAIMLTAACDSGQTTTAKGPAATQKEITGKPADPRRQALSAQAAKLFGPLPAAPKIENPARINLGRMLYSDTRLSREGNISCNSCHRLNHFGVDNEPTSPGHENQRGVRNSPTVYNAALNMALFWDGRAAGLNEQIRSQILDPLEMAMPSEGRVVAILAAIPGYVELFQAAFPDGKPALSFDNVVHAIAGFVEGLVTPDRFDAFMQGDLTALSDPEVSGLELFIETGCTSCHSGPLLGGTMYQKTGLVKPYELEDSGRFAVTGNEADRGVFKVPGLRNVAKTAPYFHDGSVTRLVDSIHIMAEHQLGRKLSDADAASIAMFLESLTGTPDADYIAKPELPRDSVLTRPDAS